MLTSLVAVGGGILLLGLAILVGVSTDTERQYIASRELTRERRDLNEQLRRLREERWRLSAERKRQGTEGFGGMPSCDDCQFRDLRPQPDEGED